MEGWKQLAPNPAQIAVSPQKLMGSKLIQTDSSHSAPLKVAKWTNDTFTSQEYTLVMLKLEWCRPFAAVVRFALSGAEYRAINQHGISAHHVFSRNLELILDANLLQQVVEALQVPLAGPAARLLGGHESAGIQDLQHRQSVAVAEAPIVGSPGFPAVCAANKNSKVGCAKDETEHLLGLASLRETCSSGFSLNTAQHKRPRQTGFLARTTCH